METLYPSLMEEWDYILNEGINPKEIFPHSFKRVAWKCRKCGETWITTVDTRVRGSGCPYCVGKKVKVGINDLETLFPLVALDWDYEYNKEYELKEMAIHSGRIVNWKCHICGYRWSASVGYRTRGYGCPRCFGKRLCRGENDLETRFPNLALEWDCELNGNIKPSDVTAFSHKKVYWKCKKCGETWDMKIYCRSLGMGCPYCSGRRISSKNNLKSQYPELAKEWDCQYNSIQPDEVTVHSDKKVRWRCKQCGGTWITTVSARTKGSGCPYCAGRRVLRGMNDLESQYPELAKEWDGDHNRLKPYEVTSHSNKKVMWKCKKCKNTWEATVSSRTKDKGHGCPFCAGRRILEGVNDLESQYPQIAEEWDFDGNEPLRPNEVRISSQIKYKWICGNCKNMWRSSVKSRIAGSSCPYCSGRRI
ncbi:MAG: zinc-ribbon domain-containing protein [Tannerellaceae bacterium]|nr:zinc-ribbon domain-containing protein [Tannerellaceae bacterium]